MNIEKRYPEEPLDIFVVKHSLDGFYTFDVRGNKTSIFNDITEDGTIALTNKLLEQLGLEQRITKITKTSIELH